MPKIILLECIQVLDKVEYNSVYIGISKLRGTNHYKSYHQLGFKYLNTIAKTMRREKSDL